MTDFRSPIEQLRRERGLQTYIGCTVTREGLKVVLYINPKVFSH